VFDRLLARLYDPLLAGAERRGLGAVRAELLRGVTGTVVVVGAGTGADLPHLPDEVERLVLVEPSPAMREQLTAAVPPRLRPVTEVVDGFAEQLPLDVDAVDHAVLSLVLCSVRDPAAAVAELDRVLRPRGTVRVLEHGATEHDVGHRVQRVVNPLWRALSGGCNLDRDPEALLARHFDVAELQPVTVPAVSRIGRVTVGVAAR
jgi:ubiquinone/menaquinone biosynthesis C-methylase UbiE